MPSEKAKSIDGNYLLIGETRRRIITLSLKMQAEISIIALANVIVELDELELSHATKLPLTITAC